MKKLAVAMLLLFSIIITGCTNNAAKPNADNILSKNYADIMMKGKYTLQYKTNINVGETVMSVEVTTITDGKASCSITKADGMENRVLNKDNVMYIMNDANKTYTKKDIPSDQKNPSGVLDTTNMKYVTKGKLLVDNKNLPYEEYIVNDGTTIRYFFEGEKLYAMSTSVAGGDMVMIVLSLNDKIATDMLNIPDDYKEVAA